MDDLIDDDEPMTAEMRRTNIRRAIERTQDHVNDGLETKSRAESEAVWSPMISSR